MIRNVVSWIALAAMLAGCSTMALSPIAPALQPSTQAKTCKPATWEAEFVTGKSPKETRTSEAIALADVFDLNSLAMREERINDALSMLSPRVQREPVYKQLLATLS